MIQSVMLVTLGFLLASLLAIFIAPAFWARAVRLTTARIKGSLPVSESEIRADKDQLRAQYAVRVHQLEKEIEEAKLKAARQLIGLNRRDASITDLEAKITDLQSDLDENRNARHVLEQTINDRLPRLESRLGEAKRLLDARDREIAEWARAAANQEQALAEAQSIHEQQNSELERLRSALMTRQGRDRRRFAELGVESEQALRSELERLRARAREQSALIQRLQMQLADITLAPGTAARLSGTAGEVEAPAPVEIAALRQKIGEQTDEIEGLKNALADMELVGGGDAVLRRKIGTLTNTIEQQIEQIEWLKAERDAKGGVETGEATKLEGKSKLKSKLNAIEAKLDREERKTDRLKTELAAANERAARQSAYYAKELKRFGGRRTSRRNDGWQQEKIAPAQPASEKSRQLGDGPVRLVENSDSDACEGASRDAEKNNPITLHGLDTPETQASDTKNLSDDRKAETAGDDASRLLHRLKSYENS